VPRRRPHPGPAGQGADTARRPAAGGSLIDKRQATPAACLIQVCFLLSSFFLSGNLIAWDGERQRNVTEISSFFSFCNSQQPWVKPFREKMNLS
jgi:hypothetical protein